MGRTGCCKTCATIYKTNAADEREFLCDFFYDYTPPAITPNVYQCEVDSAGNIYQVGDHSGQLMNVPFLPQVMPMYTLRSWDNNGSLRWSWSEALYGTVASPGGQPTRYPPVALTSVRVAANTVPGYGYGYGTDEMIIVGTESIQPGGVGTIATALDTDGNVLWRVGLGHYLARIHSCGPTRSVWRVTAIVAAPYYNTSYVSSGWILMRNSDGAILHQSQWNFAFSSPQTNWTNGSGIAAIDHDDIVYELTSQTTSFTNGSDTVGVTRVTRYSHDGAWVDWSIATPYMSGRHQVGGAYPNVGLGEPISSTGGYVTNGDIFIEHDAIIISTLQGYERLSKSDGSHVSVRSVPVFQFLISDAVSMVVQPAAPNSPFYTIPTYIHRPNGDRWNKWSSTSVVKDARRAPDGGTIWSVTRRCVGVSSLDAIIADPRYALTVCAPSANVYTATYVDEQGYHNIIGHTGIGYTTFTTSGYSGCTTGCTSLTDAQISYITNAYYISGTFTGSQVVAGWIVVDVAYNMSHHYNLDSGKPAIPAAASVGSTFSMDCY
jgi:hypothetical protein